MKIYKKILALLLSLITVFSLGAFSAGAADADIPAFRFAAVSETSSALVMNLELVSGKFNAVDFKFELDLSMLSCEKITAADSFKNYCDRLEADGSVVLRSANAATSKIGIASTKAIEEPMVLYTVTFSKKTSAPVKDAAVKAVITNCAIYNFSGNVDVTGSAKMDVSVAFIDIKDSQISMNYKSSLKPAVNTSCSADSLVWSSSDKKIVTVSESGEIYAAGTGTATITVTNADGSVKDTCKVTVKYAWWQWIIVIVLFGFLWY